MPCKPVPRGATPLTLPEPPLHRRPLIWMATVGALLLVMGLSLSGPDQIDAPVAGASMSIVAPSAASCSSFCTKSGKCAMFR